MLVQVSAYFCCWWWVFFFSNYTHMCGYFWKSLSLVIILPNSLKKKNVVWVHISNFCNLDFFLNKYYLSYTLHFYNFIISQDKSFINSSTFSLAHILNHSHQSICASKYLQAIKIADKSITIKVTATNLSNNVFP